MRNCKLRKRVKLALISLVLSVPQTQAGLVNPYVDPYIGWALFGSTAQNQSDESTTHANDFDGFTLGTRAGVRFLKHFFGGLDFSYQTSLNVTPASVSYFTSGVTATRLGIVVGVYDPVFPVRVWLGFNFIDTLNQTLNTTLNGISPGSVVGMSGTGWKIGVGCTALPLVSLNIEYIASQYGSLSVNQSTTSLGSGVTGDSAHSFLLSASVPLTFYY